VVAFLDTGSGKTFIAVLLLRHRLERHAAAAAAPVDEAPAAGRQRRRAPPPWLGVFLAPRVALVQQQAAALRRALPVRVEEYVGAGVEGWDAARCGALTGARSCCLFRLLCYGKR
jgi:endoribonuclease Dicer